MAARSNGGSRCSRQAQKEDANDRLEKPGQKQSLRWATAVRRRHVRVKALRCYCCEDANRSGVATRLKPHTGMSDIDKD